MKLNEREIFQISYNTIDTVTIKSTQQFNVVTFIN